MAKRIPVSWWALLTDGVREPMKETWRQGAVKQSNSLTDSGCSDIGGVVLVLRPARAPVRGPRVRPAGQLRRRSGGDSWFHQPRARYWVRPCARQVAVTVRPSRSEEHTSELQSI